MPVYCVIAGAQGDGDCVGYVRRLREFLEAEDGLDRPLHLEF